MLSDELYIWDAHCDTITTRLREGESLLYGDAGFTVRKAEKYRRYVQVMAVWMHSDFSDDFFSFAETMIRKFSGLADPYPIFRTAEDIKAHTKGVGFLIGIEGGEAINGSLENLRSLYKKGVRLMTLTWNVPNAIADTAVNPKEHGGLTSFGAEVIAEMERLGMAVDVSHISEQAFWDVCRIAKKPIIASHSSAKALCDHPRNLTDEQFKAIRDMGGVVGINFYPVFLGGDKTEDIVRHILHFLALDGENTVGLGSDFDGIASTPRDMCGTEDMYRIAEELLQQNIAEKIVQNILYNNMENYFLRILSEKENIFSNNY